MKENTTKDIDVYSKDTTVIERPESYNIGVKVGWTAPAKWWNWLFNACTIRLKELFNTTTSIHNEIKNAVGGTLDPESDTQLKDKLEKMKKDLEAMTAQVSANLAALEATKAKPNGIASLDPDGRVPYSQLPESTMEFKGDWNASTNTPALADGTGDLGDMYLVSVGGTVDLGSGSITFLDGDRVIYNQAGKWEKISGGSVKSVNTARPDDTGNVNVVVDTEHIGNGAVTTAKIASSAVTSTKIADKAVIAAKIADGAVITTKIGDRTVIAGKIADGAVTTTKIADNAITKNKMAVDSRIYGHTLFIHCKGSVVNSGGKIIFTIFSSYTDRYAKNLLQLIKDMVDIYGTGGKIVATGVLFPTGEVSKRYTVMGVSGSVYASGTHRLTVYTDYTNFDVNSTPYEITEKDTSHIEIISEVVNCIIAR